MIYRLRRRAEEAGMDMSLNGTLVVAGYEAGGLNRALFYAGLIPEQRREFTAHAKTEFADLLVQIRLAFAALDVPIDVGEMAMMGEQRLAERIQEIAQRNKMDKMVVA